MPRNPTKTAEDIDSAASEAAKGAVVGAAKVRPLVQLNTQFFMEYTTNIVCQWGLITAFLGVAGYVLSPIYRNLTVQFKVYIQTSGMTLGGMIGADRQLRDYEFRSRREKKRRQDEAVWKRWEGLIEEEAKKEGKS